MEFVDKQRESIHHPTAVIVKGTTRVNLSLLSMVL